MTKVERFLSWEFIVAAVAQIAIVIWFVSARATEIETRVAQVEVTQSKVDDARIARIEEQLKTLNKGQENTQRLLEELLKEQRRAR